jgi:hypothetical protein
MTGREGAYCEPVISTRRSFGSERLNPTGARQVYCDDLLTVRSRERQRYVNAFLFDNEANKLSRLKRNPVSVLLPANDFPLDRLSRLKLFDFTLRLIGESVCLLRRLKAER